MASPVANKLQSLAPSLRALVVGGTGGIGQAIAVQLANASAASHVTIAGRNATGGQEMAAQAQHKNLAFKKVDASLMKDVRRFCDEFKQENPAPLDVLVMTQGILTMQSRNPTAEDIDFKMALHYYSRMLFVRQLESLGALSPKAVVMTVLDGTRGNFNGRSIVWDDPDLKQSFSLSRAADHCISFTDAMVQYFAAQHPGQTFVHAYPGFVKTHIMTSPGIPAPMRWASNLLIPLMTLPDVCAGRLLSGMVDAAHATDKRWSNIDSKGGEVQGKPTADQAMLDKVSAHTWEIVDGALAKA